MTTLAVGAAACTGGMTTDAGSTPDATTDADVARDAGVDAAMPGRVAAGWYLSHETRARFETTTASCVLLEPN